MNLHSKTNEVIAMQSVVEGTKQALSEYQVVLGELIYFSLLMFWQVQIVALKSELDQTKESLSLEVAQNQVIINSPAFAQLVYFKSVGAKEESQGVCGTADC